jgi:hypothetical protein
MCIAWQLGEQCNGSLAVLNWGVLAYFLPPTLAECPARFFWGCSGAIHDPLTLAHNTFNISSGCLQLTLACRAQSFVFKIVCKVDKT